MSRLFAACPLQVMALLMSKFHHKAIVSIGCQKDEKTNSFISTKNLQKIVNSAAGKNVLYFPHGTYLVSDTLVIPPGSR